MFRLFPIFFLFAVVGMTVTGCSSDKSNIENLIKQHLKDPASARFQATTMNHANNRACILWNAKNSFGGYGESSLSSLIKTEGHWKVEEFDAEEKYCGQAYFDAIDEYHSLMEKLTEFTADNESLATAVAAYNLDRDIINFSETRDVLVANEAMKSLIGAFSALQDNK